MTDVGVLFDVEEAKRLGIAAKKALELRLAQMNTAVPEECKPEKIYKRPAPETTERETMVKREGVLGMREGARDEGASVREGGSED